MSLELKKLKNFKPRPGPLLLIIMDGVGIGKQDESDGVYMAKTPCLDKLFKSKLFTTLKAHGTAVGMPSDDDMGNSEVGHNALGAGRIFAQGAKLAKQAIDSGQIFSTPIWNQLVTRVKTNNSTLRLPTKRQSDRGRSGFRPDGEEETAGRGSTFHFIGLLSDGNVHSQIDQLFSLVKRCAQDGVKKVRIHALLDGRDVFEKSALQYLNKTEELLKKINTKFQCDYAIASGGGRMVTTMDRYNADWTIVKRGWDAHVLGKARAFPSAAKAVSTYYQEDPKMTDQYLNSFVVTDANGKPVGTINDGDSVVFFNFRGDRAIELSRAFEEKDFKEFDRERTPDVLFAGMMQYDGDLHVPKHFLVNPPQIDRSISEYLCANHIKTFAISETQKFGHVTYFWNGNKSGYVCRNLEEYIEIPSDKIHFDQAPRMKAFEITDKTIELLKSNRFQFGRLNFPNGDMVGHTGVVEAIIASVEAVDVCTAKLLKVVKELKGIAVILADHGNADEMFEVKNGKRITKTSHSLNPVPFIIVDSGYQGEYEMACAPATVSSDILSDSKANSRGTNLAKRGLSNVAATLLNLLGFEAPQDYDPSLITVQPENFRCTP